MNEPTFSTREEALEAAERTFLPAGTEWTTNTLQVKWTPEKQLLTRFGALPTTLHFGSTELDLTAGEVRFVDQDHRDGGDFVVHRARLPETWLTRLRALER
jgi:hypothetical protein